VEPTAGEVLLDNENLLTKSDAELIDIRRHKMGMVFQSFGLLPHLNVIDNIAFPLKLQGLGVVERRQRAQRVIDLVGLDGREQSYPKQLSGGQQQRVGIARSLAVEPDIWFLDEPFSALDPLIRREMQNEFLSIQAQLQKSIVFITHDFLEALRIADRMMIMKDGQIVQVGTPAELIVNPADDYVADFTTDVPITRVLTASAVIEPDGELAADDDLPEVAGACCVEDLLPTLAHAPAVRVRGDDGILGVVTAENVIRALARESRADGR
jgi:glycine betaine/proline transport system ATP-binding protein